MGHHKKKKKHSKKHRRKSSSSSVSSPEPCKKPRILGPTLPTHLPITIVPSSPEPNASSDSYGPQLPPQLTQPKPIVAPVTLQQPEHSDDDNVIGPLPADQQSTIQQALDQRAEILKYEFLIENNKPIDTAPSRDTWMTELPPEKAGIIGLGPRKFNTATKTGDSKNRALWTETPLDKKKPENVEEETDTFETMAVNRRNEIMDEMVEKVKHKREKKSLLEIHREKLKKKEKKQEKKERKPFDRDADLQVNRFDEAQKKSILKKAQLLDTRFSAGRSKYL